MPRVPIIETERVQTRARPTAFRSLDPGPLAFGGGLGTVIAKGGTQLAAAGVELTEEVRKAKERADLAQTEGAYALLGKWQREKVYDPKTGALAKQGKDAVELVSTLMEDFEKTGKGISDGLGNDEQRRAFGKVLERERESVHRTLSAHERQQFERMEAQQHEATLDAAVSNAANARDDQTRESAKKMAEAAVVNRARTHGWSEEQLQGELRQLRTKLHLAVIDRLTDAGDGLSAKAYLTKWGSEIDGKEYGEKNLDKLVAGLSLGQRALAETKRIEADADAQIRAAVAKGEAPSRIAERRLRMELARQIPDADLQEQVLERLGAMNAEEERFHDQEQEDLLGTVRSAITDGVPDWRTSKTFLQLSKKSQDAAIQHAETLKQNRLRTRAELRRIEKENDDLEMERFGDLPPKEQASFAGNHDAIKKKFPDASEKGRLKISQAATQAGLDQEEKNSVPRALFDDLVGAAALRRIPGTGKTTEARRKRFRILMGEWLGGFTSQNEGKYPTQSEIAESIDRAFNTELEKGVFFDRETPAFEKNPAPTLPIQKRKAPKPAAKPPPRGGTAVPPGHRLVVQPKTGKRGAVPEENLDAWLSKNPGWEAR